MFFDSLQDPRPAPRLERPAREHDGDGTLLCFAAVPPPEVAVAMAAAWAAHGTGQEFRHDDLRLTLLTVHSGGEPPVMLLNRLCAMQLAPRVGAFDLLFDEMRALRGTIGLARSSRDRLPACLAYDLHRAALRQAVVTAPAARLNPHVPLAKGGRLSGPRALLKPVCWSVEEVFLVLKRADGSPLRRLARWKLPMKGPLRLGSSDRYVQPPVQLPLPALVSA